MGDSNYLRMAGYSIVLLLHGVNAWDLTSRIQRGSGDPDIRLFGALQYRYFTTWTFIIQMLYAAFGLSCEIIAIIAKSTNDDYRSYLEKQMQKYREIVFHAIVWPISMFTFISFWFVYSYDKHLVFHPFVIQVLSSFNNHAMHTAIGPIVIWEFLLLPRTGQNEVGKTVLAKTVPNHRLNFTLMTCFGAVYLFVLLYTYGEQGLLLYPLLEPLYGTIYFPLIFLASYAKLSFWYYAQWVLPCPFQSANETNFGKEQ